MKRLFVFGLDAAAPELVFGRFKDYLPNLTKLREKGVYGRMRSCDPPITIPAWMVMMTGKTPGELGLYGFRHRKGNSYDEITIPSSRSIKSRKIWDILGARNYKSFVMGVPPTYPPQNIDGWMISCFLTPDSKSNYTYPEDLKVEVENLVGEFIFDVPFRKEDRQGVLREIYEMTKKHMDVAEHMLLTKPWNFFMYMEIGLDRIQHAFWKYFDESHHLYTPDTEFSDAIRDYYRYLDGWLGEIIGRMDKDTGYLIVSDHGAKKMKGAFVINQWLEEKGLLKFKGDIKMGSRIDSSLIDWRETVAWGWGGYYARIFLNIEGREEQGIVNRDEYNKLRNKISNLISGIKGPNGEEWRNHIFRPEELYPRVMGNPPDLIVYFDDLYWRSAGTVGYDTLYLPENDTGPDDAVHDYDGIYIYYDPGNPSHGEYKDISIYDIKPLILDYFEIDE